MKRRALVRGSVFCVLVAVIMLGGMAMKAEAGSIRLSMADFTSYGWDYPLYDKLFSLGAIAMPEDAIEEDVVYLVAPIHFKSIPKKLKNVTLYVRDEVGSSFWGGFYGVDMTIGDVIDVVEGTTSSPSPNVKAFILTPSSPKLYKQYQYYLVICMHINQYFYGAQVNY